MTSLDFDAAVVAMAASFVAIAASLAATFKRQTPSRAKTMPPSDITLDEFALAVIREDYARELIDQTRMERLTVLALAHRPDRSLRHIPPGVYRIRPTEVSRLDSDTIGRA